MKSERRYILVTGATGWIGRQVCDELQRRDCQVAALAQVPTDGPWSRIFSGGLNVLKNPSRELLTVLGETKTVVHCAARVHRSRETPGEKLLFEEINVVGTRDLVAACSRAGIGRVVYVSTVAAYDWSKAPASGVSEDDAVRPQTIYSSTKLQGEHLIRESELDWRIARLATVFGSGDKANFLKLARGLKRKRFVVPGDGGARKSVIPVGLVAEILVRLAIDDKPQHRLMNVALSPAPTLREICNSFSQSCGFSHASSMPLGVLRVGAGVGSMLSGLWPACPLTLPILDRLIVSTVVNNRRLRETYPDLYLPDFAESLNTTADFYRNV